MPLGVVQFLEHGGSREDPGFVDIVLSFDGRLQKQQPRNVKTTLDLPDDLVREAKLRAVHEGKKLKDVISELIHQGLGHPASPVSRGAARRGGLDLPLFPSSQDAPARRLSLDDLVAAEHEALTCDDHARVSRPA